MYWSQTIFCSFLLSTYHSFTNGAVLELIKTITLSPGTHGRIDHMSFDETTQRLFISVYGDSTLDVVDVQTGRLLHQISDLESPQGNFASSEFNKLFVANDESGAIQVFNLSSYVLINRIELEEDADNIRYCTTTKRIYIGYGDGYQSHVEPAIAVINPDTCHIEDRFAIPAHPESFQLESDGRRIFVNTPNKTSLTVVDTNTSHIHTWFVRGNSEEGHNTCFPMSIDEIEKILYVGCRTPPLLAVLDTTTGRTMATVPIGNHADDVWWDSKRKRVYVSSRDGFVSVIQREGTNYHSIANITTAPGAQTCFWDQESGHLFVPVPNLTISGSFAQLLVFQSND